MDKNFLEVNSLDQRLQQKINLLNSEHVKLRNKADQEFKSLTKVDYDQSLECKEIKEHLQKAFDMISTKVSREEISKSMIKKDKAKEIKDKEKVVITSKVTSNAPNPVIKE